MTLTPRQAEVAELVGRGLSNRQIAEQLVISVRTVDAHIRGIMAKLNVDHRADIVRFVATAAAFGVATSDVWQGVAL